MTMTRKGCITAKCQVELQYVYEVYRTTEKIPIRTFDVASPKLSRAPLLSSKCRNDQQQDSPDGILCEHNSTVHDRLASRSLCKDPIRTD
jgi:hypothetical protein